MGDLARTENVTRNRIETARCHFCALSMSQTNDLHFSDESLVATSSYVVVASLGSMVPGWTLIIPKRHTLNLADDYTNSEFVALRTSVSRILAEEFGAPVRIFEHGAMQRGSQTGCGVDHGHLHMVPITDSLRDLVTGFDTDLRWIETNSARISRLVGRQEYLFYSDESISYDSVGMLATVSQPKSQFFRQVVAHAIGQAGKFDYRSNRFETNIRETQRRIRAFIQSRATGSTLFPIAYSSS